MVYYNYKLMIIIIDSLQVMGKCFTHTYLTRFTHLYTHTLHTHTRIMCALFPEFLFLKICIEIYIEVGNLNKIK